MICIGIERGAKTIVTVEERCFILFKKRTKYQCDGKIVGDFYKWLRLPDHIIVGDVVSFQLDAFLRHY